MMMIATTERIRPMPRKRPFAKLRGLMAEYDDNNETLGRFLGRTSVHISRCLNGWADFTLSEQWKIMRRYYQPAENLHKVFPEGGAL